MQRLNLSISILLAFFAISIQGIIGINLFGETNVTTSNLIKEAGYPVEQHEVTTDDGYILTLFRIPHSSRIAKSTKRQPILLQHGLAAASTDFIILGPPNALAYILSDNGFDVWLGNSRGNRYSLKHVSKDTYSPEYWNFTWHEMGVYDLPAVFDYISNETGFEQLNYIGHSQGTTEFVVFCTIYPSCKTRIKAAHLLAPVIFTKHFRGAGPQILSPIIGNPDLFSQIFGSFEVVPNSELFYLGVTIFCNDYSIFQNICAKAFFSIMGPSNYLNESMLPLIAATYPAGSSFKQVQHYLQEHNSGKFCQFDYGELYNLRTYGSAQPPNYNLDKISAPLYLYYSETDFLGTPKDVSHFVDVLPEGVIRGLYKVPQKEFNHVDFLYGMHVETLLYKEILKNIRAEQ